MEDDHDDFENDAEDEAGVTVDFLNEIDEELQILPAKRSPLLKKLSFGIVALLLVIVGLLNLAMIISFLSH